MLTNHKMLNKNKKSQITIFILVGFIILISAIFLIYLSISKTDKSSKDDINKAISSNLMGKSQAENLIDSCLSQITNTGISIMRFQGGFINIPSNYKTLSLPNEYEIYMDGESKKIRRQPNSQISVPFYVTADEGDMSPSITTLENELENYIKKELPLCVNKLEPIEKNFKIEIEEGAIDVNVTFGNNVIIKGNYDFKGKIDNLEWQTSEFLYEARVDIRKMHYYAKRLSNLAVTTHFLENFIKEQISLYGFSGTNPSISTQIPPLYHSQTAINPTYKTWNKDNAIDMFKQIISKNLALIKFNDTTYTRITSSNPIDQSVYDSYIYNYFLTDKTVNISLYFNPTWNTEIDIRPNENNILRPSTHSIMGIPFLNSIQIVTYNFKYDVKLPIFFQIHDYISKYINPSTKTITGNETDFYFLVETFICGNKNRACNFTTLPSFNTTYDDTNDYNYCDFKKLSNTTIKLKDKFNNNAIINAKVSYRCASSLNDCFIGMTDTNGTLSSNFPSCTNGFLYFMHKDYRDEGFTQTITTSNTNREYDLLPLKEFNATIKLIHLRKFTQNWNLTNGYSNQTCDNKQPLTAYKDTFYDISHLDQAIINLKGKQRIIQNSLYEYKPNTTIKLAPGNYTLTGSYMGNITIIPSTSSVYGKNITMGFAGDAPDYETFEGDFALGYTNLDITLDNNLYDYQDITFYIFTKAPSNSLTETNYMLNIENEFNGNIKDSFRHDSNCSGTDEEVTIELTQSHYKPLLNPTFSN
jgi:hypothetical protein